MENEKMEDPAKEGQSSWSGYLQNSTFHGMRYIVVDPVTGDVSVKRRGALWLLLVLLSVGVFTYQVSMRVGAYLRYDSRVGMEVVYSDKVLFPAVTVCNQNQVRLTRTVELGQYAAVSNILSGGNEDIANLVDDVDIGNDTREFLRELAHNKSDLVDSCMWQGMACNVSRDFSAGFTDMGVCYTFNAGRGESLLYTNQSGSTFGLSLVLNVEQYEYLPDTRTDAGIKIYLHDQGEEPLMKDLGFAVPPGKHTILAVKRSETFNKEAPWGRCESEAPAYSTCQLRCRAEDSLMTCNCLDPRLSLFEECAGQEHEDEERMCSPAEVFQCGKAMEGSTKSNNTCLCGVACHQVAYEPMMSFASLSNFNIDQLLLEDPVRAKVLHQKLVYAKETAQKVSQSIVAADQELIGGSLDAMVALTDVLNMTIRRLSHDDAFYVEIGNASVDAIDILHDILEVDALTLDQRRYEMRGDNTYYSGYSEYGISRWFISLRTKLATYRVLSIEDPAAGDYVSLIKLHECVEENQTATFYECRERGSEFWDYPLFGLQEMLDKIPEMHETIDKNFDRYAEILEYIKEEVPNPEEFAKHNVCMHELNQLNDTVMFVIENIVQIKDNMSAVETIERLENMLAVVGDYYDMDKLDKRLDLCRWYFEDIYRPPTGVSTQTLRVLYEGWKDAAYASLLDSLEVVNIQLGGLQDVYPTAVESFHKFLQAYLDGASLKLELTEQVTSRSAERSLVQLERAAKKLEQNCDEFRVIFSEDFKGFVTQMYADSFNTSAPVFSKRLMFNLGMVKALPDVEDHPEKVAAIRAVLDKTPAVGMKTVVGKVLGYYGNLMDVILEDTLERTYDVQGKLDRMIAMLKQYQKETRLNGKFFRDNFLQVDIYFPELNYDVVTQQVALGFIALLSEVGGLMGLLLGASVLTICELFDHVARLTCGKMRGKKPGHEQGQHSGRCLDENPRI